MSTEAGPARRRRAYAPRVPAEQRRTQLLDAALHLVVTRGHPAVTMEAVAEQAGVTKPVVYGIFTGRTELLAALLQREQQHGLQQLLDVLPDDLASRADADPGELLGQVFAELLDAVRSAPERWHCIVMPLPDMPVEFHQAREHARALVLERAAGTVGWLLRTIGAPPTLDQEIVTHAVITLFEMAARLVLTDPEHFHPDRFVDAVRAAVRLAHGR